jgi:glycosyltransferase involved in cell wall biosynthesis
MQKVIHLIPYDGIGGVETAARSMGSFKHENINFEVAYIYQNVVAGRPSTSIFSPWPLVTAAWRIRNEKPNFLVVSLWRSAIVGLMIKLLRPQVKLVTFLHLDKDVHLLDLVFTRASIWFSSEIWADSAVTISGRLSASQRSQCRQISFVTRRFETQPIRKIAPVFIYWGRISEQKGLDRALRIFAEILKIKSGACFWIVGPDSGALPAIKFLCTSLGLLKAVTFKGPASHDQIISYATQASFYLQTSIYEGMAMSVVEAMQLGLVPIVTPVGEIGTYCQNNFNAVVVESDQKAVKDVINLLQSNGNYLRLRTNAIATWQDKPLYRDSVLDACKNLVGDDVSLS